MGSKGKRMREEAFNSEFCFIIVGQQKSSSGYAILSDREEELCSAMVEEEQKSGTVALGN